MLADIDSCGNVQLPCFNSRVQRSNAAVLKLHERSVAEVRLHLGSCVKKYMKVCLL